MTSTSSASVERTPPALSHARVAMTGRLACIRRCDAVRLISTGGGLVIDTVSRRTSHLVVGMDGWPLLPDGSVSRKLKRAETLNDAGASIRIISEVDFLEIIGRRPQTPEIRKSFPADRAAELTGVDEATLRRWEFLGLVRSEGGSFDFQDLVSLRTIAELIASGVPPQTIGRSMRGLAQVLPGTDRPLAQLKIVIEDEGTLLAEIGETLVAPDGQLMLNFRAPDTSRGTAESGVALCGAGRGEEPAIGDGSAWFEHAQRLEEQDRLTDALDAYRKSITADPHCGEAHYNLGNVLRALGRLEGAEERFRVAVEIDPALAIAWYNLADIQEEVGHVTDAMASLRHAVDVEPTFADAHFNLAYCCEQCGDDELAQQHWRQYLRLDPDSEWALIALEHLGER